MMIKHAFILILAISMVVFFPGCHGQPAGYSISIKITGGSSADSLTLGRYEGSKPIMLDILPWSSEKVVFEGPKPLVPGMYTISIGKKGKIDFLVSDSLKQLFSITADAGNLLPTLSFENSPENSAFAGYLQFLGNIMKQQAGLRQRMARNSGWPDSVKIINSALNRLQNGNLSKLEALGKQFPGSILSLFLQLMKDIKIPEPVVPSMVTDRNRYIQEYYYRYQCDHFFDGIDFSDPRIASLPLYEEKLRFYFYQLIEPVPEATEPKIEKVLAKARANGVVYKFTVRFLYRMYRESAVPSLLQESVFIAENFILNDPDIWNDETFLNLVREKVAKAKMNPVGLPATELKLIKSTGEMVRLSEVKARKTILYFFNPDCEACLPITEKLYPVYLKHKDQGVEVFAVYLDRKTEVWKQYISSKGLKWINVFDPTGEEQIEKKYDIYAIPMIYLLDQEKKIIARDVPVEMIEEYLP
jgi:thiol-disulfide isomerase/thioredoxin